MKGTKKLLSAVMSLTLILVGAGMAVPASASVMTTVVEEQQVDVANAKIIKQAGTADQKDGSWQVSAGKSARFLLAEVNNTEKLSEIQLVMNNTTKTQRPYIIYICEGEASSEAVLLNEGEYVYTESQTLKGGGTKTFIIPPDIKLDTAKTYYVYFVIDSSGSYAAKLTSAILKTQAQTFKEGTSATIAQGVTVTQMEQADFPDTVGFITNVTSPAAYGKIHYTLKADGKTAQNYIYDMSVIDEGSEADCNFGIVVENVPENIDIKCSAAVE